MISTLRCILTRVKEEDYENIKGLVQNVEVRRFLGRIVDTSRLKQQFEQMKFIENQYYWVVRKKTDQTFIGLLSLDDYHDTGFMELSYQFVPTSWGKGYATEAAKAVLDFAFHELRLDSVVAETQSANQASIRLLRRIGMCEIKNLARFGEP